MWGYGGAPRVSSSHSSTPNDHCGKERGDSTLTPNLGAGGPPRSSTSQSPPAGNQSEPTLSTSQASSLSLFSSPNPAQSWAWGGPACIVFKKPMSSQPPLALARGVRLRPVPEAGQWAVGGCSAWGFPGLRASAGAERARPSALPGHGGLVGSGAGGGLTTSDLVVNL